MQLQKEVKSNPKQPSCKKDVWLPKKAIMKKDVKSKVAAKKWFDGRLMAKILIMTIQVNLFCLLHILLGFGTKFTWIAVIKIFAISLPSSHFLAATLDFTSFFTMAFLGVTHLFYLGNLKFTHISYLHTDFLLHGFIYILIIYQVRYLPPIKKVQ